MFGKAKVETLGGQTRVILDTLNERGLWNGSSHFC